MLDSKSSQKYSKLSTWPPHAVETWKKIGKMNKQGVCLLYIVSEKSKEDRISIATSRLPRQRNDLILQNIIRSDEKGIFNDNI